MTSAFYKYILTTMVRVLQFSPFRYLLFFTLSSSSFSPSRHERAKAEKALDMGRQREVTGKEERGDESWEEGSGERGKDLNMLYKEVDVQRRMAKKKRSEVKVMTDETCPFSFATRHLHYASGVSM